MADYEKLAQIAPPKYGPFRPQTALKSVNTSQKYIKTIVLVLILIGECQWSILTPQLF